MAENLRGLFFVLYGQITMMISGVHFTSGGCFATGFVSVMSSFVRKMCWIHWVSRMHWTYGSMVVVE